MWLLLAAGCCVAIAHGTRAWKTLPAVDAVVRMSTTLSGKGQFFPLASKGYTEQTSISFPLLDDGQPHEYSARLSGLVAPGAFRLDPGSGRGRVVLHSVRIESRQGNVQLEGASLRQAVRPLNHLTAESTEGPLSLRSEGTDPYMEVAIPSSLFKRHHVYRVRGALVALAGAAILFLLAWLARSRLRALVDTGIHRNNSALFGVTAIGTLALLGMLGTGCAGLCSVNGLQYGSALLMAAAALAVLGAASLRILGIGDRRGSRVFLWIATGQLVLVLYVYLRSALHAAVPVAPLSAIEPAILVVAALAYLWTTRRHPPRHATPRQAGWLVIELALLGVICVVVADRELPRLLMLSSDPDTHAYLARQVELRGAIPWHGEAVFGYPGGTAVLGFIWAKLSLLDVRNSVTALPLLQSFFSALMLGEALALRTRSLRVRLLVMLTTLGITAAGFLIPLYVNYSHMEGAGRQMAIATATILPALLLSGGAAGDRDGRMAVILLASLFMLAVLNPVSVVVPIILGIAWVVYRAVAIHRVNWWLLAIVALPALLLVDPYYFQLITDPGSTNPKITINEAMQVKTTPQVLTAWWGHHVAHPLRFLLDSRAISPGQAAPMFAVLLAVIVAMRLALKPAIRIRGAALLATVLLVLALMAADGLFAALRDDRRFYLLAPYYAFTLGQFKILLVTAMAGGVILLGRTRGLGVRTLAIPGVLLILLVRFGMHETQHYALEPRADYCGSLGCATPDDIEVMTRFSRMIRQPKGAALTSLPRVLVPNSVHDTRNEDWVFPVAGARALPFYDVPPVAFFYYQGDDDYTTEAYKTHVCRQFDRNWLAAQGVGYVFLPSNRDAACLDGMEQLPATEEVLVRSGNSYLLRLRDQ